MSLSSSLGVHGPTCFANICKPCLPASALQGTPFEKHPTPGRDLSLHKR